MFLPNHKTIRWSIIIVIALIASLVLVDFLFSSYGGYNSFLSFPPFRFIGHLLSVIWFYAFYVTPVWIIPFAVFQIYYPKRSVHWHALISEMFLLVHGILVFFYTRETCFSECFGILFIIPLTIGALVGNLFVQYGIGYFRSRRQRANKVIK